DTPTPVEFAKYVSSSGASFPIASHARISVRHIFRGAHAMSNVETVIEPTVAASTEKKPARAPQAPRPPKIDESKLIAAYANFCRVTGTPEELIVDFGLNAQPIGPGDEPVEVTSRIVLNYFTAKRLMQALGASV